MKGCAAAASLRAASTGLEANPPTARMACIDQLTTQQGVVLIHTLWWRKAFDFLFFSPTKTHNVFNHTGMITDNVSFPPRVMFCKCFATRRKYFFMELSRQAVKPFAGVCCPGGRARGEQEESSDRTQHDKEEVNVHCWDDDDDDDEWGFIHSTMMMIKRHKESIYRSWVCDLIGQPSSTR